MPALFQAPDFMHSGQVSQAHNKKKASLLIRHATESLLHTMLTFPFSKLEQLEQELRSIKQVVHPHGSNGSEAHWSPPSPRASYSNASENQSRTFTRAAPQAPTPLSEPAAVAPPSAMLPEHRPKTGPTQTRMLGDKVVLGDNIDWYFDKYEGIFMLLYWSLINTVL